MRSLKLAISCALTEQLPSDPQKHHSALELKHTTHDAELMLKTNKKRAKSDSQSLGILKWQHFQVSSQVIQNLRT